MLGDSLSAISSRDRIKEYVERKSKEGGGIVFVIPVCPTRWPKRLLYDSTEERGKFYDSNPLLSDAADLLLRTQEFASQLKSAGVNFSFRFTIFATDETDYIGVKELDPWKKDEDTRNACFAELEAYRTNLDLLMNSALGEIYSGSLLNISDASGQKTDVLKEITQYAIDLIDPTTEEIKLIEKMTLSRFKSFNDPRGFYYSAQQELPQVTFSMVDARSAAILQIATYRQQFKMMQDKGEAIAIDTATDASKLRMALLTRAAKTSRIINIYPSDRKGILKSCAPRL